MKQLENFKAIIYHLYPGLLITAGFVIFAPLAIKYGFPPQFGMLLSIIVVAVPILFFHMRAAKRLEEKSHISDLNGFKEKLPLVRLILYSSGLVIFAFIIWGITQRVSNLITAKLSNWLPSWYTVQDFHGYSHDKIVVTLIFNLVLNGFMAPYIEELYFRGYLLPRMQGFGKYAFLVNCLLFSLYHFWQPYIYLTLFLALLPMIYLVVKTRDLRLSILTHSLLNLIGAILSFGMVAKH
ncbi:CPBP family intramembrane metalloprotease [Pedobacter sp. HMF7647]|uniref:CPBP family intramembrane metalloprotease n=1 Tax=Hufsiella arboris TaxID=2695275 RepID=A0A7K1YDX3_9SPHI|nr:CPBP family intramembrane glutamic endopeptidase [Hufsiella arboris]MXV52795.1 CPBP family intramembrane metalloprotease [Hufsiella arboris]